MLPERLRGYNKSNEFANRARFSGTDYATGIRWTPLKIIIGVLCVAIPYITVIVVIASVASIGAVMPLIVLPFGIVVIAGLAYGVGLLGSLRHQPKQQRKQKRRSRR